MSYELEREDAWAYTIFKAMRPDLDEKYGWPVFRDTPVGRGLLAVARIALKKHLECCEHRCEKCKERLTHRCLSCDRA